MRVLARTGEGKMEPSGVSWGFTEQRKGTKPSWAAQAERGEGSARPGGAAGRTLTGCQELRRGGRARVLGKAGTGRGAGGLHCSEGRRL